METLIFYMEGKLRQYKVIKDWYKLRKIGVNIKVTTKESNNPTNQNKVEKHKDPANTKSTTKKKMKKKIPKEK